MNRIFGGHSYTDGELESMSLLLGFDATFYSGTQSGNLKGFRDFLEYGMYDGKLPCPLNSDGDMERENWQLAPRSMREAVCFDESYYRAQYPNVQADPLDEFLTIGMREGRHPFQLEVNIPAAKMTRQICEKHGLKFKYSLEEQDFQRHIPDIGALADDLIRSAKSKGLSLRKYRDLFWLGLSTSYLGAGKFGLATICVNFFFNYYIPLPALGNWNRRIYEAGRVSTVREYAAEKKLLLQNLPAELEVAIPEPLFLNRPQTVGSPAGGASRFKHRLSAPCYTLLERVAVTGETSIVKAAPHHFLYEDLDRPGPRQAELKTDHILQHVNGNCTICYNRWAGEIDEGIFLLHDHDHNYFHWLIELFPRYLLSLKYGLGRGAPIIVSDCIAPQELEALRLARGVPPVVVRLRRGERAHVERLHWISPLSINTVHTHHRPERQDIVLSPTAFALIREALAPYLSDPAECVHRVWISRRGGVSFRRLVNQAVLASALEKEGFLTFDPGAAGFREQVRVFSRARVIVSEAGAGLANLVFCAPGTEVFVLVNGFEHSNYYFLAQMAQELKLKLRFFECSRINGTHELGVQDDMIVNVGEFLTAAFGRHRDAASVPPALALAR